MLQPRWLLILIPLILTCSVKSLTIVRAILPSNVEEGNPLWLNCTHDLPREKLYSIKWYKDGSEFYQYIPSNRPSKRQFALEGIYLDIKRSHFGNVYLKRTDHNSAGLYKCEISSEAPLFKTLRDIKKLNIVYNSSNHKNWSFGLIIIMIYIFFKHRPSI